MHSVCTAYLVCLCEYTSESCLAAVSLENQVRVCMGIIIMVRLSAYIPA